MKRRILITGGSGFIGTNLVAHYSKSIEDVVVNIDIKEPLIASAGQYWKPVSLLDKDNLIAVVRDFLPTHVIHLAARTDLEGRLSSDYAVNTLGTQNLIDAIQIAGSAEKIIFTSSMLVCRPGYIPRNDLDFTAATVYGESKIAMELLIRKQHFSAEWIIVRPTSIWGPWFNTPYRDFFDRVIAGKMYNIKMKGSPCEKTYGFVLNTVYQLDKLLNSKGISGQVFYLGDQPPLNINEWANHICDKLQIKHPIAIPYPVFSLVSKLGDFLNRAGIAFPMTSFRLKNMTTSNVLPLENLYNITGPTPYSQSEAVSLTLEWINNNK